MPIKNKPRITQRRSRRNRRNDRKLTRIDANYQKQKCEIVPLKRLA